MVRPGDTIQNRPTGERIVILATARQIRGEAVDIEAQVEPEGSVAAAQVHPSQQERFSVQEEGRCAVTASS